MNEDLERKIRYEEVGLYIAKTACTVREAAKKFGIPKSTIYQNIIKILPEENKVLAESVAAVLKKNKTERCIRGGMATKAKYAKMKEENS